MRATKAAGSTAAKRGCSLGSLARDVMGEGLLLPVRSAAAFSHERRTAWHLGAVKVVAPGVVLEIRSEGGYARIRAFTRHERASVGSSLWGPLVCEALGRLFASPWKARVKTPRQHVEDEAKKKGTVESWYNTHQLMVYLMGRSRRVRGAE